MINQSEIASIRLASQHLGGSKFTSPKEIVAWMGAIQAQDYPMAKWAIGVRLAGSTDLDLETASSIAGILRTHLLRPTWHFVTAEDIYWLIDLSAAQIKAAQNSRERILELTGQVFAKSNRIIEKALSTGRHLTRDELVIELNRSGISTDNNRAAHLFTRAELEKIICSGGTRNGKTTYALLAERVPTARNLSREEALAELARRYFTSRCPASLQDFTWWSGLPARDANLGLELVKSEFTPETIDKRTYWLASSFSIPQQSFTSVYLLPTYDEFIISYAERSASIPGYLEQTMKRISNRGVFRPIIVVNGQVVGIWKRKIEKNTLLLVIKLFETLDQSTLDLVAQAAQNFGSFSGRKIEIQY